jgi:DNA-directed RNA polymerase specialized sigma24 family protein
VRAIRGGESRAESELVERYSRGLRYFLLRRVGDQERVRDLLQETLAIAIEKLPATGTSTIPKDWRATCVVSPSASP